MARGVLSCACWENSELYVNACFLPRSCSGLKWNMRCGTALGEGRRQAGPEMQHFWHYKKWWIVRQTIFWSGCHFQETQKEVSEHQTDRCKVTWSPMWQETMWGIGITMLTDDTNSRGQQGMDQGSIPPLTRYPCHHAHEPLTRQQLCKELVELCMDGNFANELRNPELTRSIYCQAEMIFYDGKWNI